MRSKFFKSFSFVFIVCLMITACDSEKEIERTHDDDHEVFGVRTTKNDTGLNKTNTEDSIRPIPLPDTLVRPK